MTLFESLVVLAAWTVAAAYIASLLFVFRHGQHTQPQQRAAEPRATGGQEAGQMDVGFLWNLCVLQLAQQICRDDPIAGRQVSERIDKLLAGRNGDKPPMVPEMADALRERLDECRKNEELAKMEALRGHSTPSRQVKAPRVSVSSGFGAPVAGSGNGAAGNGKRPEGRE